jgi:hypothetical protein
MSNENVFKRMEPNNEQLKAFGWVLKYEIGGRNLKSLKPTNQTTD